jgi:hypothetical protein
MLKSSNINAIGIVNFRVFNGDKTEFDKGYYLFNLASMV